MRPGTIEKDVHMPHGASAPTNPLAFLDLDGPGLDGMDLHAR